MSCNFARFYKTSVKWKWTNIVADVAVGYTAVGDVLLAQEASRSAT